MIVEHRLRKFESAEQDDARPTLLWCKWFKTRAEAQDHAAADSSSDVVWIGNAALSEEHTYDIKRFEINP